jgi:hypothetical protein
MIKYSGLSTLANAWTCYTQPTPVPHLGDNAPPALSSMSFLSAGLSTLANAWTCYTQPTPVPHLGDNAPPALNSMSFLSAVARRRMTARTSVNRFFCLAWSPTPFLLMSIRVVALLVIILVSVTIGLTKLLMKMDMHPGFLRTGW